MKKVVIHIVAFGLLALFLCLMIPHDAWAQLIDDSDSEENAPRIYKYSARTGALGDATIADAGNISVININPAGLSFVPNLLEGQINLSQNWNNNLMLENFTLPGFRANRHSFAAQFGIQHDRGFESLNLLGENPMGTPKIMMYQLDVAYSFAINDFSIGLLNNISYANNPTSQSWAYYPTLGIFYAPNESLSYGLTFRGLGTIPTYVINTPSRTTLGTQELTETLDLGTTLKFPVHADRHYFSLSLATEKRFGEDHIWYKAGLELTGIPHLALRTGLIVLPENDMYAPRFGVGILSNFLELDYTISHHRGLFERYHQLGVTLNFANTETDN